MYIEEKKTMVIERKRENKRKRKGQMNKKQRTKVKT